MVTGVSSGIGMATALELARRGLHLIAAGRSAERTMPVVARILDDGGSAEFLSVDLSSLESVRSAIGSWLSTGRSLDVLVANAGVGAARGRTEDGFEIHFGVNHLGHFLLTVGLLPSLSDEARVVVVSSEAHRRARGIDLSAVRNRTGGLGGMAEYSTSKLANILFARRLASLRPGLRTYSLHPGVVATRIFPTLVRPFMPGAISPEEGADTSVWCVTAPELAGETGRYYIHRRPRQPSPEAEDDALAEELWERSAEWCGMAGEPGAH